MNAQLINGAEKRVLPRCHNIHFERLEKTSVEHLGFDRDWNGIGHEYELYHDCCVTGRVSSPDKGL